MSTAARFGPKGRDRVRKSTFRPFAPQDQLMQEVYFFDDFLGYQGISPNVWINGGTGGTGALATDNTNGVWQINCISSNSTYNRYLVMANQMFSRRQKVTVTWRCKVASTTSTYVEVGLCAISSGAPSRNDYVCFRFSTAVSSNWYLVAALGGDVTSVDTGISNIVMPWFEFELTPADTTLLLGRINRSICPLGDLGLPADVSYPNGGLAPYIWIQNVGKNIRNLQADYCEIFCDRS